jgi:hypothetical protein
MASSRAKGAVTGLALAGVVADLALGMGSASAKECSLKRLGSADLAIRDDRLVVQVTVNGHPGSMELDTSSPVTLIRSSCEAAGTLRPASELRMHERLREVYNWVLPRPNLAVFLPDWQPDRRRRGTKVDRPGA